MQLLELLAGGALADTLVLFALLVAVGSLLARRPLTDAAGRTALVTLSWLGCLLGLGAVAEALAAFDALVAEVFVRGFDDSTVADLNPVLAVDGYAHAQVLTVLLAVLTNVGWARFGRARYLFVNPLHLLLSSALSLGLFAAVEVTPWVAVPIVGVALGSAAAWLPWLAAHKLGLSGNGFVLGSLHTLALGGGRWLAAKVGAGSTGERERPEALLSGNPKTSPILLAALLVGGIAALAAVDAGPDVTATILQGVSLLHVFPSAGANIYLVGALLLGFEVAIGLWLLLQCLPMVAGALSDAVGGLRRWLPEVQLGLDAIFLLPEAPRAAVLGFLLAFAGGTLGYYLTGVLGLTPVVPGVLAALTGGGALGVLAQRSGGRRGLLVAAPVYGLVVSLACSLLVAATSAAGAGAAVELSDAALIGIVLALLLRPFA